MTRPEVSVRLVIRAVKDASPTTTWQDFVSFFHVSTRTVADALRRPVLDWATLLLDAPEPSTASKVRASRHVPVLVIPSPHARHPGDRADAVLVKPSDPFVDMPEPKDFDAPEPVIDEAAIDRARNEAIDELDDQMRMAPEARRKTQREKR